MVVKVSNHLDLTSSLALASSSPSLSSIFTPAKEWTTILNKMSKFQGQGQEQEVREKNEEEVKELANFLRTVKEPDQPLDLLLHFICRQHLATGDSITIVCSFHHHQVQGWLLLSFFLELWVWSKIDSKMPP